MYVLQLLSLYGDTEGILCVCVPLTFSLFRDMQQLLCVCYSLTGAGYRNAGLCCVLKFLGGTDGALLLCVLEGYGDGGVVARCVI